MPSIYQIKPRFQALLRPLVRALAAAGMTANVVTLGAAMMSVVAGIMLARSASVPTVWFLLPGVLLLRMALNAIDGMLAREHDQKSALGAFLNELCDVISDAALYLPFALIPGVNVYIVIVVVLLAALSEMTGVVAVQIGADRRYDGPMGKSDRAFVFGALAILIGLEWVPSADGVDGALGIIGIAIAVTIVNRIRAAIRQVAD